ncbi:organoarsenical effux MFS transporter ArsJ [SAR92 clade bacterium H455]|uniref:Organoarsenical effux MFS transporter ArsJ n=1 Tax=SAR92 clade bacterium H455 TaxID=2974818 RepID=A0ABY5TSS2_9GAMM|nr:organoarsenical effux MFS transporter ArsJ [SAR92 clade bacterium H455]
MNFDLKAPATQYGLVTLSYWAFTLSDGALRMLVVLFFHQLGYSPIEIAGLLVLYELFGVITNLYAGWLATTIGLTVTMQMGLALQIAALLLLTVDSSILNVVYVMVAQALSGIGKDLNKMGAKASIKSLVPADAQGQLYHWIALLTGSKNALKGVGFFLGGWLLATVGFQNAVAVMATALGAVLILSVLLLDRSTGIAKKSQPFQHLFSKSSAVNRLSTARFFLFGSRDVWFVVALPVFLQSQLQWSYVQVGTMMAAWVIAYGMVQAVAPKVTIVGKTIKDSNMTQPSGRTAFRWVALLCLVPAAIAGGLYVAGSNTSLLAIGLVSGLLVFGALFAINSSIHSYLIVAYAREDGASLDVGFYYMCNAAGRLVGTLLSGLIYQQFGLAACLLLSSGMLITTAVISKKLPG